MREQPKLQQARYLLGLCYFFVNKPADAARNLEILWVEESNNLNYLYVLGLAAKQANLPEWEERALSRLIEIGHDAPEFHLLMGKAHLNRGENDLAIAELEKAAASDAELPFVHFNLGVAYVRRQDYERARQEFLRDVAIEPDIAYNYDQLGQVYVQLENDVEAERNFREAIRLDPQLLTAQLGLARLYFRTGKFAQGLVAVEVAEKLDPTLSGIFSLKGQLLAKLGREQESEAAVQTYRRLLESKRNKREHELEQPVPNPELTIEPH